MIRARVRFAILIVALLVLGYTLFKGEYEVASLIGLGIVLLIRGYYRDGTVFLAAKAFRNKDYDQAEQLLKEVPNPDRLRRARRGYYEFILANIELHRGNDEEAEKHFQIASRFPLSSSNDKALILLQLANLNLKKRQFDRVRAYVDKAKTLKISPRVENIIEKLEKEIERYRE